MDWARVKTILITVFLIVNIFLILKIIDKSNSKELRFDEIQSIKQLLDQNNVQVKPLIPTKVKYMQRIKINDKVGDGSELANKILGVGKWIKKSGDNDKIVFSSGNKEIRVGKEGIFEYVIKERPEKIKGLATEEMIKNFVDEILNSYVLIDDFQVEKIVRSSTRYDIVYSNYYRGNEIFNNNIHVEIYNSGEIKIQQGLVSIEGFVGNAKRVAVVDALIELIRREASDKPTIVNNISLGYYADFGRNGITYGEAHPAWKIETGTGTYIFDGYNGNLIYKK